MRLSAAIVVLAAGAIARAQLSNIPQCSLTCFTSTLSGDGCSELTDFACHCQKPGLAADIVPCINKACDVTDRQATSFNSTTVSSYGSGFKTSSTISAISAQSTSQFNGASSIAPGAVQMFGGAVLLAGMTFFI
ncbi:hypothetical protein N7453_004099 [Penicillium expansum]|nr:hypothetical protein N7453_004099 [Penicillium expansum]